MRPRWLAAAAAGAASGALYGLSLPKVDASWLAWACLLPLFFLLLRPPAQWTTRQALLAGGAHGLVAGTFRVYWIAETLGRFGGLDVVQAVLTTVLLILYLSLYPAVFLGLSSRLRPGLLLPVQAAAVWCLLDWVQTWMASGFPWAVLGTTQYQNPAILSFAALVGVHGLTFAIVLINGALALLLWHGQTRTRVAGGAWLLAVVALMATWGAVHHADLRDGTAPSLHIGIVQGNIRQGVKWEPTWKQDTTQHYIGLTEAFAKTSGPLDLIVWPETALPYRFDDEPHAVLRERVVQLAATLRTPLLVGSLGSTSPDGPGLFNRSFLLDSLGQVVDYGDKKHLVPFGEYLPFPWLFGYLQELTRQSGAFDPGLEHGVLQWGPQAPRLGLFICYESIFPAITRHLAATGAQVLINTTNDAWFGTTAAPEQHLAMVVLRAVETGRWVVRAANTGISAAIAPDGSVHQATELFETAAFRVTVEARSTTTPYTRWGDVVFVVSGAICFLCVISAVRLRRAQIERDITQAHERLQQLSREPVRLKRPVVMLPGYDSSVDAMRVLRQTLYRCFSDGKERLLEIDLRHDEPLQELAERVRLALPDEPVDFIGHSLGGLVGVLSVRPQDEGTCVFALATPFYGSRLATVARWLRFRFARTLRDLSRNSDGTRAVRQQAVQTEALMAIRLSGDPMSSEPPGPEGLCLSAPLLLGPTRRHRAVHADPRVIVEIVQRLRDRY